MTTTSEDRFHEYYESTVKLLYELRLGIHKNGFKQLTIAIPCFYFDTTQSLTKELYPFIADYLGYHNWYPVERSIRFVILDAWEHRDPTIWEKYFPNKKKPPSNKQFIATLAALLESQPLLACICQDIVDS